MSVARDDYTKNPRHTKSKILILSNITKNICDDEAASTQLSDQSTSAVSSAVKDINVKDRDLQSCSADRDRDSRLKTTNKPLINTSVKRKKLIENIKRQLSGSDPDIPVNTKLQQKIKKKKNRYDYITSKIDIGKNKKQDRPASTPMNKGYKSLDSLGSLESFESSYMTDKSDTTIVPTNTTPMSSSTPPPPTPSKDSDENRQLSESPLINLNLPPQIVQPNTPLDVQDQLNILRQKCTRQNPTKEPSPEKMDTTGTAPSDPPFQIPKKTSKKTLFEAKTPISTPTNNKFKLLSNTNTENLVTEKTKQTISPKNKNNQSTPQPPKTNNPPPLIITGVVQNHANFCKEINKYIKKGYYIRYTRNNTILQIKDKLEYDTFKRILAEQYNHQFHTYTSREDKKHAFVLYGLQGDPLTSDIKDNIEEDYGITVHDIYKLKTNYTPLYMIITDNSVTLKELQTNVKYILSTKIRWDRRRNDRIISQCRRCQQWGHATTNCYHKPRCVKCAGNHWTRDCNSTDVPKCANCNGGHTASNIECPIYKRKIESINKQGPGEQKQQTNLIPAPEPATNPWAGRHAYSQPNNGNSTPVVAGATNKVSSAATNSTQNTSPSNINQINDFNVLMNEVNKLNNKINLTETIKAIQKLNEMLDKATNPMQIIATLQDFTANELPKYKISSMC